MGPRRAVRVAVVPRRRPATEGALVGHPACRSVAAAAGAPVVEITAGLDPSTAPAPCPDGATMGLPAPAPHDLRGIGGILQREVAARLVRQNELGGDRAPRAPGAPRRCRLGEPRGLGPRVEQRHQARGRYGGAGDVGPKWLSYDLHTAFLHCFLRPPR